MSLWKDASQKSFNYALPHVNYGLALEEAGKTEEAKKEYFLALNPEVNDTSRGRASTANKLAIIYFNEGNDLKGLKLLDRALEYDSSYVRTYYHFGLYYYFLAKESGNRRDYRTGIKYLNDALKRSNGKYYYQKHI